MSIRKFLILFTIQLLAGFHLYGQSPMTNVPTIYINTENSVAIDNKEEYVNASLNSVSSTASENLNEAVIRIRGRGNSTWRMAKKSYRIKFADKLHFLNLPAKEDDWVLLANYADKTLMRNAVAFELSHQLGFEFTPSAKFVDLVLNGEYMGTYMVSDQIEVKNDRIPLEKQDPLMISLPDISGGYLLESDGFSDGIEKFKTTQGINVVIKYPDDEDINDPQRQYISSYTQEFEDALFSSDFKDEQLGYRAFVDVPTLVNYYIVSEFTGNSDAFWSTYFYKKRNDPLFKFGPVWDFDIAFNNDKRLGDATEKLMKDAAHNPKQWIRRFLEDQYFQNEIALRWIELKEKGILDHLLAVVDQKATELEASQQLNFERWDILNTEVYLELEARGTYEAEVDFLRNYIISRYEFLDSQWKYKAPTEEIQLLAQSENKKVLVPKSSVGTSWFSYLSFNDEDWQAFPGDPAGVGYEKSSGYENLISLDVGSNMYSDGNNPNTSCYVRIPFNLTEDEISTFTELKLHIYYDDGFIAYLNGQKVYGANAPENPVWNSTSTGQHEANSEDIIELSEHISLLKPGGNLLAIHGLNASLNSSDFIIVPRLNAYKPIVEAPEPDEDEVENEEDDVVTSIRTPSQKGSKLFPNPVTETASLSFDLIQSSEVQVLILDQRGRLVVNQFLAAEKGKNLLPLSVSAIGLSSGVYEIKVVAKKEIVLREKMVVIK